MMQIKPVSDQQPSPGHRSPPATGQNESVDLLVVIPHLGPGGAQRVATLLMNHWRESGVKVAVMTLFDKPDRVHELDGRILEIRVAGGAHARPLLEALSTLHTRMSEWCHRAPKPLNLPACIGAHAISWVRNLRRRITYGGNSPDVLLPRAKIARMRAVFEDLQPRLIISLLGATNIQTVMAASGLSVKVMISERNDPAIQALDPPWEDLRKIYYAKADIVSANSAGAIETMRAFVPREKLRQVENPLVIPPCGGVKRHGKRIVAVARLVPQKAYDVLLDAFSRLLTQTQGWHLDIIGDGPLRGQLEGRVDRLKIRGSVTFHGFQPNPFPLFYGASVFALPSRFEGMPNAMLEAMGCGLAIVVSDASPGPLELVEDGVSGLVFPVDDVDALARALVRVTADDALRTHLADGASQRVAALDVASVAQKWEGYAKEIGVDLNEPARRDP